MRISRPNYTFYEIDEITFRNLDTSKNASAKYDIISVIYSDILYKIYVV